MAADNYSAEDLERLLGIKERTIHFWQQYGLLVGPGAGRGARYTDEHLGKLALIQKLRSSGLPLAQIKKALKRESAATFRALAEQAKTAPPRQDVTARQMIQGWLNAPSAPTGTARTLSARVQEPLAPFAVARARKAEALWERIPLASGVELHVQRPLSPGSQEMVDELVALARRLGKE